MPIVFSQGFVIEQHPRAPVICNRAVFTNMIDTRACFTTAIEVRCVWNRNEGC